MSTGSKGDGMEGEYMSFISGMIIGCGIGIVICTLLSVNED